MTPGRVFIGLFTYVPQLLLLFTSCYLLPIKCHLLRPPYTHSPVFALIIASNPSHALVVEQREFPGLPARPSAYPSSSNKGGTTDTGSRLTARHRRWTKLREHENSPDRGQVEEV